jgi:hypothetical protein
MTEQHEGRTDSYSVQYARFGTELVAEPRRDVFGEDIGQPGWRTAAEQAEMAECPLVGKARDVLDAARGASQVHPGLVDSGQLDC